METEFYSIIEKAHLMKQLEAGDVKAIKVVINEIQRLESVIRDYEIVCKISADKLDGRTFKKPEQIS